MDVSEIMKLADEYADRRGAEDCGADPKRTDEARAELAECLSKTYLDEPCGFMWQHEETGRIGFAESNQRQYWSKGNPRLKIVGNIYLRKKTTPRHECTRSHPHELMDGYCELRTEIARLTNKNARLVGALEKIACRDQGEVVDGSFDSPWASSAARTALDAP